MAISRHYFFAHHNTTTDTIEAINIDTTSYGTETDDDDADVQPVRKETAIACPVGIM